jgi:hypothetical protein
VENILRRSFRANLFWVRLSKNVGSINADVCNIIVPC